MIAPINSSAPQAPTESTSMPEQKPAPFTVEDRVNLNGARSKNLDGAGEPAPL